MPSAWQCWVDGHIVLVVSSVLLGVVYVVRLAMDSSCVWALLEEVRLVSQWHWQRCCTITEHVTVSQTPM